MDLAQHKQWVTDQGDKTLRLNYPLNENSIVFDLGGYIGNWACSIYKRYKCNIYSFEPMKQNYDLLEQTFRNVDKVKTFYYGLGNSNRKELISINIDSSSIFSKSNSKEEIYIYNFYDFVINNQIEKIDLLKINIEGMEYELLEHMLDKQLISKINNIQVQFHDFVEDAYNKMFDLQKRLSVTHKITYQYEMVWENWRKK